MSGSGAPRRIADRFVLGSALGAGGMGSLFRAHDERLGQAVAIKLLKRSLLENAILRERFRREALSLARLRHPGIVGVLDSGEDQGDLYTALELVDGETLDGVMDREGAMTFARAGPLADQILAALEVCHASQIVHRDLKPSNVMVRSAGGTPSAVLIDFGLARMSGGGIEKLTETGAVQGTPRYMAPEQCRGEDVGPEGDVYSAGVLLYEMLAGIPPFQGSDAATLMAQQLFVDAPELREVASHVSAGVSAAVHGALAKQAKDRPTAGELRRALAAAAAGMDPEARAESAAALRREVGGRDRAARALSASANANANAKADASANANADANADAKRVVVWMTAGERSAALVACCGTKGLACVVASAEAPDLSGANAVVVSARDGMERVRRVRAMSLPVVVVDVGGPDETTAAIRAGASDMLLHAAADADVVPKLERLMRRRR